MAAPVCLEKMSILLILEINQWLRKIHEILELTIPKIKWSLEKQQSNHFCDQKRDTNRPEILVII